MKKTLLALTIVFVGLGRSTGQPPGGAAFPGFRMEEIETGLGVGYAVIVADVNADGKPDIVVVDTKRVLWYENPSWKKRTIIEGGTRPDNVCIDAHDIDGDGKIDFALGADWKPFNTESGGTLQWLKRKASLDESWQIIPIDTEPTVHRIRFADIDGTGKPALVSAPLMGRGSTKDKNWLDGAPVRVTAYRIPKDPVKDRWVPEVLDQSLHVIHNLWPVPRSDGKGANILCASYEGVSLLYPVAGKWMRKHLGIGNQDNPKSSRGASEIKQGVLKGGKKFIATIEPWHGFQVVVYTEPDVPEKMWDRHVLDDKLRWGHGVWTADLDGDGSEELIIGIRDDLDQKDQRRGVRLYKALDERGAKWSRQVIDNGGVAVEDLTAGDLNGDGRIDLIAAGRQTKNVRIYWNLGMQK